MSDSAPLTCETLLASLPELFVSCLGDRTKTIRSVRSAEHAEPDSVVFCNNLRLFESALTGPATVLVVPTKLAAAAEMQAGSKSLLLSPNVERAMATVINRYFLRSPYTNPMVAGQHPSAVVDPSASLGKNVRLGPNVVIAARCTIGDNVYIGAGSVLEQGATIGHDTVIHPLVYIGHGTHVGDRCEVLPNTTIGKEGFGYAHDEKGNHYRIPHQGRVFIENDVHIGANCSIDRATFDETRIGSGTKIDNQVHIAHNCKIGRNCLLTAKFAIAGSSTIGDNFVAGGSSTVTGHIRIGNGVQISGMSTVTKDLPGPGQYGGFPLAPLQDHLKIRAALLHLPSMRKQLSQLMSKVFASEAEQEKSEK